MDRAGLHNARIQRYGRRAEQRSSDRLGREADQRIRRSTQGKTQIINALETNAPADKQDLNNASSLTLKNYLLEKDPLQLGHRCRPALPALGAGDCGLSATRPRAACLHSLDELKGAVDPAVVASLQDGFFLSDFGVRNVEIVGPQVGKQLQKQAMLATAVLAGGNVDLSGSPV